MAGTFKWDVFISYAHQDTKWVAEWLLPGLEKAGLRVCVDFRDFQAGVPSLVNMENAVAQSRKTLIVLTPDWVKSVWTEFESLLVQTNDPAGRRARMIPLRLKPCKPPSRIAMLTYLDFGEPAEWDSQLARLVGQIRGAKVGDKVGLGKGQEVASPIRLLHLSDLHFGPATPIPARLQWLRDDLKLEKRGLGITKLDYLMITGDLTDRGCMEGFPKAYEFVSGLIREFGLSADRCILVPGNHDVVNQSKAYDWRPKAEGFAEGEWVQKGDIVLVRNAENYPLRFKAFSDGVYERLQQRPYPTAYPDQGMAMSFRDTGIQFVALNSSWQIDEFYPRRAGVHPEALAHAIAMAQRQEQEAREAGQWAAGKPLLRIAVWHHAVTAPDFKMADIEFLGHLQDNGVRLGLHGDVHEARSELVGYRHSERLHIVGAGSFGARAKDRPEAMPRLYNVLEIQRDLSRVRVYTRSQPNPDSAWRGWHEWPNPRGEGQLAYYDIAL